MVLPPICFIEECYSTNYTDLTHTVPYFYVHVCKAQILAVQDTVQEGRHIVISLTIMQYYWINN